jgi:hypothetical protein
MIKIQLQLLMGRFRTRQRHYTDLPKRSNVQLQSLFRPRVGMQFFCCRIGRPRVGVHTKVKQPTESNPKRGPGSSSEAMHTIPLTVCLGSGR